MADDDSLLDVFVNVRPRFEQDMDEIAENAIKKLKEKFVNAKLPPLVIPSPVFSGGSGGSGGGVCGRSGRSAGSEMADDFRQAKRAAEDLQIRIRQIADVSKEIGNNPLSRSLRDAVKDVQLQLRRAREDEDVLGLEETLRRLDLISARVTDIQTQAFSGRTNKSIFDRFSEEDRQLRVGFNVESAVRQQAIQGISSEKRNEIIRAAGEVKILEDALKRAQQQFDGTDESLQNFISHFTALNGVTQSVQDEMARLGMTLSDLDDTQFTTGGARKEMLQIQGEARKTGSSFNNLSNNAYQAGQAIEDFAVGFSLNGIAGGVRGAANNIAFILNDMSRLPQVTNIATSAIQKMRPAMPVKEATELAAKFAGIVPLAAGIGSALAIVVLPKMIEWLESINDIEAGFRDISQEISDAFDARDFSIKFDANNQGLKRTIADAKSVQSVLEKIRDLSIKSDEKRAEFEGIFKGFDIKELGLDQFTPIQNINAEFEKLSSSIQKAGENAVLTDKALKGLVFFQPATQLFGDTFIEDAATAAGIETPEVATGKLRQFKQEVSTLQLIINDVVQRGKEGVADPEIFVRAQRQIADFKKNLEANIGRLDLTDVDQKEAIAAMTGIADAVAKDFKKAEDILRETANITRESFAVAFEGVKGKVKELQTQLDLSRQVARGANVEFDLDLFGLDAQINEGRKLVEETISSLRKAADESGVKIDEGGLKAIEEEFTLRSILSLEQLRKKNSEDLLDLEEKRSKTAKFTALEEYSRQLQLNALRSKDEEEEKRKILLENAVRIDRALEQVKAGEKFTDVTIAPRDGFPSIQEQKERDAAAFKEAIRELMNPLGKIEGATKETTEAVKKIPGAVAR